MRCLFYLSALRNAGGLDDPRLPRDENADEQQDGEPHPHGQRTRHSFGLLRFIRGVLSATHHEHQRQRQASQNGDKGQCNKVGHEQDYHVNSRYRRWLVVVAAIAGILVTASLGRWQLSRAAQKEAVQAAMNQQSAKTAVTDATLRNAADPLQLVHQHSVLRGTWMPDRTVFLDNRQMNSRVGFFAITPLRLEGGSGVILVQRGWVPRNFERRDELPAVETPAGVVQVEGRIAPPPSKLYEPGSALPGVIRQNMDLEQFRRETGLPLMPVILQQTGAASEGLLREWPAVNLGVDKHYGYAFQWFGLSALIAVLYLWFQVVRPIVFRPKDPTRNVK